MSTLIRSAVIVGALAAPLASQAATPTLGDVLKASGVTESGYIDAGFNYNNRHFNAAPLSYGDANVDSFTVNQVGLTLSSTPSSGFGGVVDVLGGHDTSAIPSDNGGDIILKQAYAQYASGNLTVMGGRFVTLAGAEVIASTGNSNASRSLLFGIQPLTHTGVRGSFKLSDALSITGGVNNSVFGTTNDADEKKTVELQAAFAPTSALSLALTGYKGHESTIPGSPLLLDFVGNLGLTKTISLGLNIDHANVDDAAKTKLDGAALYANLQATDTFRFGFRGEYLKTKDSTGTLRKQKEVTLTAGIAAASNFDLLTDLRFDKDDTNPFDGGTEDSMMTLLIKGIYKF